MSFYQLCYTRTGMQEMNAGWNVVASTPGISETASERFRSIAANIIRQKNLRKQFPEEILFLLSDDSYVYLGNIVMECGGGDGRGNSFVHGYTMVKSEYYQRCKAPYEVFGVRETAFIKCMAELTPERMGRMDELPHNFWQGEELRKKCGIEKYYGNLMRCVFSVLDRKDASLFIKVKLREDEPGNMDLKEVCKMIMCCILEGVPHILRPRITFSSYDIGKGKIRFMPVIPDKECEYFDLETGISNCDMRYTRDYTFLSAYMGRGRNQDWIDTENFLDHVFGAARCSNVTESIVESVYLYYKGEKGSNAARHMERFCKAGPLLCEETERILKYWGRQIEEEESAIKEMLSPEVYTDMQEETASEGKRLFDSLLGIIKGLLVRMKTCLKKRQGKQEYNVMEEKADE